MVDWLKFDREVRQILTTLPLTTEKGNSYGGTEQWEKTMLPLKQLQTLPVIDKIIVHSLTCSHYQVSAVINGEETFITDKQGNILCHQNIAGLQALFERLPVKQMVLRHQSAYDEMIGQPVRQQDNTLEVPLSRTSWGNVPKQFRQL